MATLHNTSHYLSELSTTPFPHSSSRCHASKQILHSVYFSQTLLQEAGSSNFFLSTTRYFTTTFQSPPSSTKIQTHPLPNTHIPRKPPSHSVARIFNIRRFTVVMTILFSLRLMIRTLSLSRFPPLTVASCWKLQEPSMFFYQHEPAWA